MNLVVAAINLSSAIYWLVTGEFHGVAISLIGAYCSVKAHLWLRG